MEGRFYIDDPDYMKATLEITMTIGEWKLLRDSLNTKYIPNHFRRIVTGIINTAEAHFSEKVEVLE